MEPGRSRLHFPPECWLEVGGAGMEMPTAVRRAEDAVLLYVKGLQWSLAPRTQNLKDNATPFSFANDSLGL